MSEFTWIVENKLAAMPRPWPQLLAVLPRLGVRGVISLTGDVPAGLPNDALVSIHLPVRDFHPPTQAQLARAVAFVDEVVSVGGAVAVHCTAGLGRTGTVVAAWLVSQGFSPADAVREVRRRRPGSVETFEQELALQEFARQYQA